MGFPPGQMGGFPPYNYMAYWMQYMNQMNYMGYPGIYNIINIYKLLNYFIFIRTK